MTVNELVKKLEAHIVIGHDLDKQIKGFYAGDFLSNVMAKAPEGGAWFTVMNNVNVAGVAVLTDVAVVVLCEGVNPDLALEARAEERGLNIIVTQKSVYDACIATK